MERERLENRVRILSALANETRLMIIENLEKGEMTVSEITGLAELDISTVSRHLAVLKHAGLVSSSPRGNHRVYKLETPCVLGFLDCVEDITEDGSGICAGDVRERMQERQ